ncbi:MAG: glycosyltransferase [SAR202 cluster bacterium]|nr:glycosyltransferase [SAR202 cluster bacterium]
MPRIAILSVHGCPVARLGEKDSGGMNVYVLEVAKELGRLGNPVEIYTRFHDPDEPQTVEISENVTVVHIRAGSYSETKQTMHRHIPDFLDGLRLFRERAGLTYDMIHSHYWLSGYAGVELSRELGVPHVATFHTLGKRKLRSRPGEIESPLRLKVEAEVMRNVDKVVVSTEEERDDVSRLYEFSRERVDVIPGGVNLNLFTRSDKIEARRALGIQEDKVILSVGRPEPLKGLDILVGALCRVDDLPNTRLVLVGGEPGRDHELQRLQSIAGSLGVLDKITFAGAVGHSDIPKYMNAADVFVMPSYHESFGLAALEAMACGVPVMASRVGGLKTIVRNGQTGYLIDWHCPEPFAQQLDVLLSNRALRETMGMEATARAEKMSWNRTVFALTKTYAGLTGKEWMVATGE